MKSLILTTCLSLLPLLFIPLPGNAFGVLTHEAVVDAAWNTTIVPLLRKKFPGATDSALQVAHAYAYGGAVAPDMGYYPFGSRLFTDLVHYVRSGDMVNALLEDAENLDEYAFALGFLSHFEADTYGHPLATNRSVPLVYPKLKRRYGPVMTYAEDKVAHVRMEFGFDVLEVAKGNYASPAYHSFIGFKVDTAVLSKAFYHTYGLTLDEVFNHHLTRAVETFRWVIANIFPSITRAAWSQKKRTIQKKNNTVSSKHFYYKMRQRQYDKQFGKGYRRPGFSAQILSFFIRVLPKFGPLRPLKFRVPTPDAEKLFQKSFDTVLLHYSANVGLLKGHTLLLPDVDYDTGRPTADCQYSLSDDTYCDWLMVLKADHFRNVDATIKGQLVSYFQLGRSSVPQYRSKKCAAFYLACRDLLAFHPPE